MDKLTLEILSAYLPWGLQCHNMGNTDEDGKPYVSEIIGLDQDGVLVSHEHEDDHYVFEDTFPLLRPLSIQFLTSVFPDANDLEDVLLAIEQDKLLQIRHDLFTELVKNHGDVYSLIPSGLAVEIKEGV